MLFKAKGDLAAAEPLCREALEGQRETLGSRHPDTLTCISNLGMLFKAQGDLAAAEPLCREALEMMRKTLGDRHPNTLICIKNLGTLLQAKGDRAAAELLLREALVRHPSKLRIMTDLGEPAEGQEQSCRR